MLATRDRACEGDSLRARRANLRFFRVEQGVMLTCVRRPPVREQVSAHRRVASVNHAPFTLDVAQNPSSPVRGSCSRLM